MGDYMREIKAFSRYQIENICRCCGKDKPDVKVRKIGKEAEMKLCQGCYDLYLEMESKLRG